VPLVTLAVARNVLAIVLMGNPRHVPGLVFNAGNATAGGVSGLSSLPGLLPGPPYLDSLLAKRRRRKQILLTWCVHQFAARPRDFRCPVFEDRIQAYCDDPDPFCSNSTDDATHESYGQVYGKQALGFVISRLII
jgi:acetylxylan esterase